MAEKVKNKISVGNHSFVFIGDVVLGNRSLEEPKLTRKGNHYNVDANFGVKITDDGNVVYPRLTGFSQVSETTIKVMPKERQEGKFKLLEIPFEDRFKDEVLDKVAYNSIITIDLGDGAQRFVLEKEALDYLKEKLTPEMRVRVYGDVDYAVNSLFREDRRVYRNYNIRSIYLARDEDENMARLTQDYYYTENSLSPDWKKEIKENKKTTAIVHVPVYLNTVKHEESGEYVDYKKVVLLPQVVTIEANGKGKLLMSKIFNYTSKEKGKVKRFLGYPMVNEGYEQNVGEVKISPDIQALIDEGYTTLEEMQKSATTRGNRVRELLLDFKPIISESESGEHTMEISIVTELTEMDFVPEPIELAFEEQDDNVFADFESTDDDETINDDELDSLFD